MPEGLEESLLMSIWETLSTIDCSQHIEKKGQFSYLSWTWAWAMVAERYSDASYQIEPDTVYSDGTMEVRMTVKIDGLTHTMWLPVLDFKNKAIQNPNAFDINSSRMRCLVKCLAMFGLGHYIYAGESFPAPDTALQEKYEELLSLMAKKDGFGVITFSKENQKQMDTIFNMAPKGKVTQFKNDVRSAYSQANAAIKDGITAIVEALNDSSQDDPVVFHEILSEMEDKERALVLAGLSELERKSLEHAIGEIE